ncbi:hypothetical protein AB0B15_40010 [Streptomyces sp. NPDC045456]|uniref:hypothetical protein n=1 Tax=Streptomyces sp. NPDC045456 TaxID=3155254 RepID=UPI0033C5C016
MKRLAAAGAAAAAAALLTLTGCGTERATGAEGTTGSKPATGPEHATGSRLFQDIAARCAGASTRLPSPPASDPPGGVAQDPENSRYAENHGYKQTVQLTPNARCRGAAHAERITAELRKAGPGGVRDEGDLAALLQRLAYPEDGTGVHRSGGSLGFTLSLPDGPCLTGRLGPPLDIEPHGAYMEGGCEEPRGGH